MRRSHTIALVAILLSGCTVGPNFVRPEAGSPPVWHDLFASASTDSVGPALSLTTAADPAPDWWRTFGDPELDSLIERATQGNLDLEIAVSRIAQARAQQLISAADGLPSLSASGSYTREQQTTAQFSGIPGLGSNTKLPSFNLFQGALDASWELDLFGKVRRATEAAGAATTAAIGDRDDSLVSLQAEVAQTYSQLRAAQADLASAKADIAALEELLYLTRDRASHGLTTDLDVQNAIAQLASSNASLPQYRQQITTSLNSLAVLVGQNPGALDAELVAAKPVPQPPATALPIGLPSSLARRRPDVRAAEARLHQQTAQVGEAIAQLYPDITLTGKAGQQSQNIGDLAKSASSFYSLGPSISLPIFEGGRLKANITQAKAARDEAALTYRKTLLSALQDVENALSALRNDQQRMQSLQVNVDASRKAVEISRDRYRRGLIDYLNVLTPENSLIGAEQQLIQARLTVTTDLVTLYKALGGGWAVTGNESDAS